MCSLTSTGEGGLNHMCKQQLDQELLLSLAADTKIPYQILEPQTRLQVRYAACVCARSFLIAAGDDKERYFPSLLPHLCFNRYDAAEGVRFYSLETWKLIMQTSGPQMVAKYINEVRVTSVPHPSFSSQAHLSQMMEILMKPKDPLNLVNEALL